MKNSTKNVRKKSLKKEPLFFDKKKLLLAFEYGVILSDVAKQRKINLTQDIVLRMEDILLDVCTKKSAEKVAVEMELNILAALEVKEK